MENVNGFILLPSNILVPMSPHSELYLLCLLLQIQVKNRFFPRLGFPFSKQS